MHRKADAGSLLYPRAQTARVFIRPASIGKRCYAFVIDLAIILMICAVFCAACVMGLVLGIANSFPWVRAKEAFIWLHFVRTNPQIHLVQQHATELTIGIIVGYILLTVLYFLWHEITSGSTPGKRLLGIQILNVDGDEPSVGQLFVRGLLRIFELASFPAALLCMVANIYNRRIGDLLAGTLVVHSPVREHFLDGLYLSQSDFEWLSRHLIPRPLKRHPLSDPKLSNYLSKTFSEYVLCDTQHDSATMNELIVFADDQLSGEEKRKIADDLRVRFFAEYITQQARTEDFEGGAA